jgi:hypothetical protein
VFTCPHCAGFAKFQAEKCEYCGAPFYWTADKLDVPKMKVVAEKAWTPPLMDVIGPPPISVAFPSGSMRAFANREPAKQEPAAQDRKPKWDDKLRITISDDGGNHYIVDEVTIYKKDYNRIEGKIIIIIISAISPAALFADWLMINDVHFNIEYIDNGKVAVQCNLCKFTGSDFMYTTYGGRREMSFVGTSLMATNTMEVPV